MNKQVVLTDDSDDELTLMVSDNGLFVETGGGVQVRVELQDLRGALDYLEDSLNE